MEERKKKTYGAAILVLEEELITLHGDLVSTADQVDAVDVVELVGDSVAEDPAGTTRITSETRPMTSKSERHTRKYPLRDRPTRGWHRHPRWGPP